MTGKTVALTLAQLHVALDDGLEHQLLEVALHLVVNLIGQTQTAVVHGKQEALYLEFGVELAFDDLYRVEQLADAFQGKVFTLTLGMMTLSAAVSELTVMQTQRWRTVDKDDNAYSSRIGASRFLITLSRFCRLSISISAPTRSMWLGMMSSPSMSVV